MNIGAINIQLRWSWELDIHKWNLVADSTNAVHSIFF